MRLLQEYYTLSNGRNIPKIGFGTAPLKGEEAYQAVRDALDAGYRHIDTAAIYGNEEEVGRAVRDSKIPREKLYITSKLDASIKSYEHAIAAFHESLKRLGMDYLDLYLIHAPWPWNEKFSDHKEGNVAAWRALEKIYEEGLANAIGISNFDPDDIQNILDNGTVVPHVNQIKYHIGHPQKATRELCNRHNILVEAYSPLGRGGVLTDERVVAMAKKHDVTPARLCVRYVLEKGALPLPRSSNPTHIKANADVDFTLSDKDIKTLDSLVIDTIEFGTPKKD